ncbi:ATP-binding protein [Arthrobacter glacialis]|uniref:ATP-binding protein n=1 Tax=Arthrobacter glacialis TaxID=1664 RepID=A0A2S4A2B8_ARTGL|nr:ATP-binding protein [Arthrobacter glacialis]
MVPIPHDEELDGPIPDDASILDDPYIQPAQHEPPAADRAMGATSRPNQRRAPTQSAELVEMAKKLYRMVKSTEGKIYAVRHDLPGIAMPIKGTAGGLRNQLSTLYYSQKGRTASSSAIQEMMMVLEGDAMIAPEEPVFLRFAADQAGTHYIDLGTPNGEAIAITPEGWKIIDTSPVLFRRTGLMSPMPRPARGGNLEGFRNLLNVSESGFRLLVGWLVAACITDIPHPILGLYGQQGTAKTTAMNTLITLISPSPVPSQNVPDKADDWATNAYNAPVIGLDNVSSLKPSFQDALCKAVTGDGYIKRENYSDSDVTVLHFRRVIALTTIDPGSLQGDVSDRLLKVDLEPIPESGRRTEKEVKAEFDSIRQSTHGVILDLLSAVLRVLPSVQLEKMPRMADFARVLAAIDQVTEWQTLSDYLIRTESAALDVIEGNLFASAIRDLVEECGAWTGTTTELLEKISPSPRPQNWPKTPGAAGGSLKRNTIALKSVGITVTTHRTSTSRRYTLSKAEIPLCQSCFEQLHPSHVAQGVRVHPTCNEPTELFDKD